MPEFLTFLLADPNLIYLLFVISLWLAVTALYVPGTGIMEVLGAAGIIGSIVLLVSLPVNWLAVALIVVGVSVFGSFPLLFPQVRLGAEAGLLLQAGGGVFLFGQASSIGQVSPLVLIFLMVVAFAYHRLLLMPVLVRQRRVNEYDIATSIAGARGRVVQAVQPEARTGTVRIHGEVWRASSDEPLEAGTPIEVTGNEGLTLYVQKAKRLEETSL